MNIIVKRGSSELNVNFTGSTVADLRNSLYAQALGVQSSDTVTVNNFSADNSYELSENSIVVFTPASEIEVEVRFGLAGNKVKIPSGMTFSQFLSNPDLQARIGFRASDKIYVNGVLPDMSSSIPAGATIYIEKVADVKGC